MSQKNKKIALLCYALWVVLHFILLAVADGFDDWDPDLWPWRGGSLYSSYDWFDFFVYCAIPPVGYGIYLLTKSIEKENN